MVQWPAIVKYENDVELAYINNQSAWNEFYRNECGYFTKSDQLIDSGGYVYSLGEAINMKKKSGVIALEDLTQLIRSHVSMLGGCCVSKLVFVTTREAITSIGSLVENE